MLVNNANDLPTVYMDVEYTYCFFLFPNSHLPQRRRAAISHVDYVFLLFPVDMKRGGRAAGLSTVKLSKLT